MWLRPDSCFMQAAQPSNSPLALAHALTLLDVLEAVLCVYSRRDTHVHVSYTSLIRPLHVSKYQDTRSVPGQSHSPHNNLGQCKHQIRHYHTITRSLCDIFVIFRFYYASITSVTRGIASITRVASPLCANYVHSHKLPELHIDGAYSTQRCQLGQTANFVNPKHVYGQKQFVVTLPAT